MLDFYGRDGLSTEKLKQDVMLMYPLYNQDSIYNALMIPSAKKITSAAYRSHEPRDNEQE